MRALIEGFDYTTHQRVELTRQQWQAQIATAVAAGGRRRVEGGETFIHGAGARIIAEAYANIPAKNPSARRDGPTAGQARPGNGEES